MPNQYLDTTSPVSLTMSSNELAIPCRKCPIAVPAAVHLEPVSENDYIESSASSLSETMSDELNHKLSPPLCSDPLLDIVFYCNKINSRLLLYVFRVLSGDSSLALFTLV